MNLKGLLKLDNLQFELQQNHEEEEHQFAVILNGIQTFLIQQKIAMRINYFYEHLLNFGSYICFINHKLNHKIFQSVLNCFESLQCQFQRTYQTILLMEVITFLKAEKLRKLLINDLLDNFDHYGFFVLFEIAQKFNVLPLKQKCLYELICLEFEQLNFNRYDLMLSQKEIFQNIIQMHQYYVEKNIIKGLKLKNIKEIVHQYCVYNNITLNIQKMLEVNTNQETQIPQTERQIQNKEKDNWKRFRTPSFDLSDLTQSINFIQIKEQNKLVSNIKILKNKRQIIYVVDNDDIADDSSDEEKDLNDQPLAIGSMKQTDASQFPTDQKVFHENERANRTRTNSKNSCCEVTTPSTPDSIFSFPIIQEAERSNELQKFFDCKTNDKGFLES